MSHECQMSRSFNDPSDNMSFGKKNPFNTCTDTLRYYYFLRYDKAQKTNVYWICHAILIGKQVSLSLFKDKLGMTCLFSE